MLILTTTLLYLTLVASKVKSDVHCGVTSPKQTLLIVNGENTQPGQWPWHVAIYHRKHFLAEYACGGTLISEWFVLTAAHCVVNKDSKYDLSLGTIFIRLGIHNLNKLNKWSLQEHELENIYKVPSYNRRLLKDDIALLKLATKAEYDEYVQPACLDQAHDLKGHFGTTVGWGLTEADTLSGVLKSTTVPIVDFNTCLSSDRDFFGNVLDESVFCAGYTNGTAVCNGDSGGGLFIQREGVWYLGGIVSLSKVRADHGSYCHTEGYGVFTKVSYYLLWINKTSGIEAKQYNEYSTNAHETFVETSFGRNWIVVLQRSDGSVHFNRTWDEYRNGFGTAGQELWIGLEQLHQLTKDSPYELLIEMQDIEGRSRYARYKRFEIGSAVTRYPIVRLGMHDGTAGDALSAHRGYGFSTIDSDPFGCSLDWGSGGWWFYPGVCYDSLTGIWLKRYSWSSIIWNKFEKGESYTQLKYVRMLIRKVEVQSEDSNINNMTPYHFLNNR